jgi:hypothetical protein
MSSMQHSDDDLLTRLRLMNLASYDAHGDTVLDSASNQMEVGKYYKFGEDVLTSLKYLGQDPENLDLMRFQTFDNKLYKRRIGPNNRPQLMAMDDEKLITFPTKTNLDVYPSQSLPELGGRRKSKRRRSKRHNTKRRRSKRRKTKRTR